MDGAILPKVTNTMDRDSRRASLTWRAYDRFLQYWPRHQRHAAEKNIDPCLNFFTTYNPYRLKLPIEIIISPIDFPGKSVTSIDLSHSRYCNWICTFRFKKSLLSRVKMFAFSEQNWRWEKDGADLGGFAWARSRGAAAVGLLERPASTTTTSA